MSNVYHDACIYNFLLADLVSYHFLGIRGSLSQRSPDHDYVETAATTHEKQHPHYYIRDAPLAMRAALRDGRNTLPSAVGKLFEDMVREMIKNSSSTLWQVYFYFYFHISFVIHNRFTFINLVDF